MTFSHTTDLSKVRGSLRVCYQGAELTYDGAPIGESTVFNFVTPVSITAKVPQVFGNDLSKTIELTVKHDLSNECQLQTLTFDKANNSGFAESISVPVAHVMDVAWSADANADLAYLFASFTLSEGATATLNGEAAVSRATAIKGNQLVELVATAANGATQLFILRFIKEQSIALSQ